ncbi:phage head closure protein [Bacillus cihuensis]|uniref:phage head closure protein n=1 Tax=Bacillus cihuensis TaxID=1208599 RepID=UPI0003FCF44A|nr:phage head closure protein [Bacillus cihuensis]
MNPGQLNRRLTFNRNEEVSDGAGGFEKSLVPIKTVWANVRSARAREFYQAAQSQVEITHVVTIRYDASINRTQVITFDGKQFEIQFVMEKEPKRFLELHVVERT